MLALELYCFNKYLHLSQGRNISLSSLPCLSFHFIKMPLPFGIYSCVPFQMICDINQVGWPLNNGKHCFLILKISKSTRRCSSVTFQFPVMLLFSDDERSRLIENLANNKGITAVQF